jgi:hypothetical protein
MRLTTLNVLQECIDVVAEAFAVVGNLHQLNGLH